MSKYNLQDILNEYVGGSRHGTINISYRDLQDAMDKVEADGDFVVREKHGRSGDGKTNREFEVVFIGAARGDNNQKKQDLLFMIINLDLIQLMKIILIRNILLVLVVVIKKLL